MELSEEDLQWSKEIIKKTELFDTCTAGELNELYDGLEKKRYNSGSTILFQGEISSRLCLVETGKVSINVRSGKEKAKVAELGPTNYFGEISLLTPRAATATVRAVEDSDIVFVPGEVVQAIVNKNPVLAEMINKKISDRLADQKKQSSDRNHH